MLTTIAFAAVLLLALGLMAFIADRGMDRSVASGTPPRVEQRIPADEMAVLGDSIGDHCADYFQRRWESQVRTRSAVSHVCGVTYDWSEQ